MTFTYVSGEGTNENKRAMWARVKGRTENALLALPLKAVMFRPGIIRPMHGIKSKTRLYRARVMLRVARDGSASKFLTNRDINALTA